MRTILLLIASNMFMTIAWYGHLKNTEQVLWKAILISWAIAFFEYCLMVPANRLGYVGGMSGFQGAISLAIPGKLCLPPRRCIFYVLRKEMITRPAGPIFLQGLPEKWPRLS